MSDPGLNSDFVEVDLSLSSLMRNRGVILAGVVLGLALAAVFAFLQPDTHRSWSTVLVKPIGADPTRPAANAVDPVAERELGRSFVVAERAASKVGIGGDDIEEIRDLRRTVEVRTIENRPVLEFSYADEDPEQARDVASAVAESYLEIRREQAQANSENALAALLDRQNDIQNQLAEVVAELDSVDDVDSAEFRAGINTQSALIGQLTTIQSDIARLDGLTTDPGQIISPAQLSQSSARSRTVPILIAGAVLGAVLGLIASLFRDRNQRRDRIAEDDDLGSLGLPVIGRLASSTGSSDEYVALSRNVQAELDEQQSKVLAVTTLSNEGHPSLVATWLAMSLGTEKKVLLLSADFGERRLAQQLGVTEGPGLVDVLLKHNTIEQVRRPYGAIDVVFEGESRGDIGVVLRMVGLNTLLDSVRDDYDYVVISSPELLATDHTYLTTVAADVTLLVVEQGDDRTRIEQAVTTLRWAGRSNIHSVMLSESSPIPVS